MHGPWRADTAVVDEQPDAEVEQTDDVLIVDGAIGNHFTDHDGNRQLDAAPKDLVVGLIRAPDALQGLGNVFLLADLETGNAKQDIALADARIISGASRLDIAGNQRVFRFLVGFGIRGAVDPYVPGIGFVKNALLPDVDHRPTHRRQGQDEKQALHEL